jgi:hypothetical protein
MLEIGTYVWIRDSAEEDVTVQSWPFVQGQSGIVKWSMKQSPTAEPQYAIELAEKFSGGHDCLKACASGQGVFITQRNLTPFFDDANAVTVPMIQQELYENRQAEEV